MSIFFLDTIILQNENDMAPNRLRLDVGMQGERILEFNHPSILENKMGVGLYRKGILVY